MRTLALLTAILYLYGCTTEPFDGEKIETKPEGYLVFKGSFADFKTSKADVPECSALSPNTIKVSMVKEGITFTKTSPIEIQGSQVSSTEPMIFDPGDYTIEEISLLRDGLMTHTSPHELDTRFDFAAYVSNPLPFMITIAPNQITSSTTEMLCYTEAPIDIDPDFTIDPEYFWSGGLVDMQTLYFQIPSTSCINFVVIEVDDKTVTYPITRDGLFAIPIPADFTTLGLTAFADLLGDLIWAVDLDEYNADDYLDEDDIVLFPPEC